MTTIARNNASYADTSHYANSGSRDRSGKARTNSRKGGRKGKNVAQHAGGKQAPERHGGPDPKHTADEGNRNSTNAQGRANDATQREPAPNPTAKVEGRFVSTDGKTIKFSVNDEQRGRVDVALGNASVKITVRPPHTEGGISTAPAPVTHELDFTKVDDWSKEQLDLLDSVGMALDHFDMSSLDAAGRIPAEVAKSRVDALRDPAFWQDVSELQNKKQDQVVTLADGRQGTIGNEYVLEPVRDSNGKVTYNVFNPGDGYTTKRVRLASPTSVTFGSKKGDVSPIRVDDDGTLKVVLGFKPLEDDTIVSDSVNTAMQQYTSSAALQAIGLPDSDQPTTLDNVAAGKNGDITLAYAREHGVVEQVTVGASQVTFTTTLPADAVPLLGGTANAAGEKVVTTTLKYADINSWSGADAAMMETLRAALENADAGALLPQQETLLNQVDARLEALVDPVFWGEVNGNLQRQLNGELKGEPVAILEEFQLVQIQEVRPNGRVETRFEVDRGKGREKVEIVDNDNVKIGDKTYPVRLDEQTGDWHVVTEHQTQDQVMARYIGQHMKVRSAQAPISDRTPLLDTLTQTNTSPPSDGVDEPSR